MKKINISLLLIATTLLISMASAHAYENYYTRTPINTIQLKTLPQTQIAESPLDLAHFPQSALFTFKALMSYLQQHRLQLMAPVHLSYEQARMYFYLKSGKPNSALSNSNHVSVKKLPERTVISIGLSGRYNRSNYETGKQKLMAWIAAQKDWRPTGPAYVVYWSSPYLPATMKHSEVHIPIQKSTYVSSLHGQTE